MYISYYLAWSRGKHHHMFKFIIKFKLKLPKSRLPNHIYYLDGICLSWHAAAPKSLQSCPTLCNPIDSSPPGSIILEILQARILECLPFPSPTHESEKWKWSRSVISDSSRPRGLQPTRLLCPWDFPGKSTGVGCHCLKAIKKITMVDAVNCVSQNTGSWYWLLSFSWFSFYMPTSACSICLCELSPSFSSVHLNCTQRAKELKGVLVIMDQQFIVVGTEAWEGAPWPRSCSSRWQS